MGGLFHPDSKLMRLMMLVTNLACLNLLWFVSCIPVVTAGAATTAMYSVLLGYSANRDDAVLKPFFKAFRDNFRQVTPVWLLHIPVIAALGAGVFYMTLGVENWVKMIFAVVLFIYIAATSYLYPIFARYQTSRKAAIFNSFALSLRHLLSSVCVVTLNLLPLALAVVFPELFWKTILVWTLIGFSLIAYLNLKILLPIFKKYDPQTEAE